MPRSLDHSAIFTAIEKGVKTALRRYRAMSREVHYGAIPESYYQANIADALGAMGKFRITLEDMYKKTLTDAAGQARHSARLKNPRRFADIVIWDGNRARIIVEVKRMKKGRGLERDAMKIRDTLVQETSLEGGILVGLYNFPKKDSIPEITQRFAERENVMAVRYCCFSQKYVQEESGEKVYAGAGIFLIKKKR